MALQSPSNYSATDPDAAPRRPIRIVVADDDRDTVLSLSALLQEEGFEAIGVYNGREVGAAVRESGADAALVDIGMPGMSGYDVARELRRRYDSCKPLLIAVTAWAKTADKLMARAAGFDHHIGKPYDPNELLRLLGTLNAHRPRG